MNCAMLTRQGIILISLVFTSLYLEGAADDPTSANYASTLSNSQSNSINSIGQALGNSAVSQPITQQNHTLVGSAAPIEVNSTLSASWHEIANPFEATCAVALVPSLVYQNSYVQSPQGQPRSPTAAQVPSITRGTIDLNITNPGGAPILAPYFVHVASPNYESLVSVENAEAVENGTDGNFTFRVTDYRLTLFPHAANAAQINYTVYTVGQNLAPTSVSVNDKPCSVYLNISLSNILPAQPQVRSFSADPQPGEPIPERPHGNASTVALSVQDGQFYGTDGLPVSFKGLNWFGFETSATMVAGLWEGDSALTKDFGTVLYRIGLLGFTLIRVPFSFQAYPDSLHWHVIFNTQPLIVTQPCKPVTPEQIAQSVTPPGTMIPLATNPPVQAHSLGGQDGICNELLPNDSVFTRLLYVIRAMVDNGFFVLLDNHLNLDSTATDNPDQWRQMWKQLMTGIGGMGPKYQNSIMVDLLNEPDSRGLKWDTVTPLYLGAMDDIHAVAFSRASPLMSPLSLFWIEGCGQIPYAMNWGDGFVVDDRIIKEYGISDPKPFFDAVLTKPYRDLVVLAPHYYPPSISLQHKKQAPSISS
ncbi:hypothetical protein COCOBI_06-5390 [Coccomyxa sp. Obi]|nr:hypothetical protein COCOBI_06-5390 [Coccomyxa sp. Obi]